jgi:sugar/nucleoside kinase (ribokinase family)
MDTLVIGSTVIDVIISLPHLPQRGEDININAPLHRLGGCAYNVYETLRFLNSPALLCSPVGTGVYGRMVREHLEERGIRPFVKLEEENGCCYCLVESNGERSFLSQHGAEYLFSRVWMKGRDLSKAGSVYVSGIDVEDRTGNEIVEFVYEHSELDLYFAPGPRVMHIEKGRITRLLSRKDAKGKGPVLHLNKTEACSFSGKDSVGEAALFFAEKTGNVLVITLGEEGCYCYDQGASPQGVYIPAFPVEALDTTGAGDAHCGAVIAGLKQGRPLREVCETANKIGAKRASCALT